MEAPHEMIRLFVRDVAMHQEELPPVVLPCFMSRPLFDGQKRMVAVRYSKPAPTMTEIRRRAAAAGTPLPSDHKTEDKRLDMIASFADLLQLVVSRNEEKFKETVRDKFGTPEAFVLFVRALEKQALFRQSRFHVSNEYVDKRLWGNPVDIPSAIARLSTAVESASAVAHGFANPSALQQIEQAVLQLLQTFYKILEKMKVFLPLSRSAERDPKAHHTWSTNMSHLLVTLFCLPGTSPNDSLESSLQFYLNMMVASLRVKNRPFWEDYYQTANWFSEVVGISN